MELYGIIGLFIFCTAMIAGSMTGDPMPTFATTTTTASSMTSKSAVLTSASKSTTTEKLPTPINDKLKEKNEKLNAQIQHILETSKTGYTTGNSEYDSYVNYLHIVSYLDDSLIHIKQNIYNKFQSYNALRLKLESDLDQRIAVIRNYLFHGQLTAWCKDYYFKQKTDLIATRSESNALKIYKLMLHGENCVEEYSESEEIYYIDFNFWPIFL